MKFAKFFPVIAFALMVAGPAFAQTWTQTSAPNKSWLAIASSADGAQLVAVTQNGPVYISTNSGATWNPAGSGLPGFAVWVSVASSADGTKLAVASFNPNQIYVSRNSGATWSLANVPAEFWADLAISANGSNITAVASYGSSPSNPGPVYSSADSGVTWKLDRAPSTSWRAVASSADGTKLIAMGANNYAGPIYTSSDAGNTWALSLPEPNVDWAEVSSSANGTKLIASAYGAGLFTNSGTAWTQDASLFLTNTLLVSASADGNKLAVAAIGGGIYTSTNYGGTWTSNDVSVQNWQSIASSADGTKLAAVVLNGGIYTMQALPTPPFEVAVSSNGLAFSWTIPTANVVLQQSADLFSWADVTNPVVLNFTNLQNQVTLSLTNNNSGFFRLRVPGT
jgi:photosystem II stability/assembly factor-like uncharacterized protein